MPKETRIVGRTGAPGAVVAEGGQVLHVPDGWELLPPGDAGLTRKLKSLGPTWTVKVKRRRRLESVGVWAPAENIVQARELVAKQRAEPGYARRQEASAGRRERVQVAYVDEFQVAVESFLGFDARYRDIATRLAAAVSAHATPVGSGTVARTRRIPVAARAEAAVIAWMRHSTTAYDGMRIPRRRGQRREVRRDLAERSRELLGYYRRGDPIDPSTCPLQQALATAP